MAHDPFRPPKSKLESPRARPGSVIKGVLFGIGMDLGGTYLLGTLMVIIYASIHATAGMSEAQFQALGIEFGRLILKFDNLWSWSAVIFGLGCSFLGGFTCAAYAREKRVKALAIVVVVVTAVGLRSGGDLEVGVNLVLGMMTMGAIIAGGRLWARLDSSTSREGRDE